MHARRAAAVDTARAALARSLGRAPTASPRALARTLGPAGSAVEAARRGEEAARAEVIEVRAALAASLRRRSGAAAEALRDLSKASGLLRAYRGRRSPRRRPGGQVDRKA